MQYGLLVFLVIFRTASDICFKSAVHKLSFSLSNAKPIRRLLRSPFAWLGSLFAIINFTLWTFALNYFDLSYAYPFLSICYLSIMISGKFLFKEVIDTHKAIGLTCIGIGTLCLLVG